MQQVRLIRPSIDYHIGKLIFHFVLSSMLYSSYLPSEIESLLSWSSLLSSIERRDRRLKNKDSLTITEMALYQHKFRDRTTKAKE
jgi:hypothetical protein